MLQHADHVRFGEEHLARDALPLFVAAGLDVVDLDRDVAPVIGVVREIDDAGAAATDLVDDHVLADLLGHTGRARAAFCDNVTNDGPLSKDGRQDTERVRANL